MSRSVSLVFIFIIFLIYQSSPLFFLSCDVFLIFLLLPLSTIHSTPFMAPLLHMSRSVHLFYLFFSFISRLLCSFMWYFPHSSRPSFKYHLLHSTPFLATLLHSCVLYSFLLFAASIMYFFLHSLSPRSNTESKLTWVLLFTAHTYSKLSEKASPTMILCVFINFHALNTDFHCFLCVINDCFTLSHGVTKSDVGLVLETHTFILNSLIFTLPPVQKHILIIKDKQKSYLIAI